MSPDMLCLLLPFIASLSTFPASTYNSSSTATYHTAPGTTAVESFELAQGRVRSFFIALFFSIDNGLKGVLKNRSLYFRKGSRLFNTWSDISENNGVVRYWHGDLKSLPVLEESAAEK